jgi:hypothetical protein
MPLQMQKQTARNMVLAPYTQAAYGGALADASLTYRASVDPSTNFNPSMDRFSDAGAIGHGTDFATVSLITAQNTQGTMKGMGGVDDWLLGYMLALIFGQEVVTGSAAPYTHAFSIQPISTTMPCTTIYCEDTADIHRKYADMSAKSLSIDVPERGPLQASLDMVGTGLFVPGSMVALPAIGTPNYLLGSDFVAALTPSGGAAVAMSGRQKSLSIKIDRGTAPFKASGDGLTAKSNQAGNLKFSVDLTVMANSTDDIEANYENNQLFSLSLATNPALAHQLILTFPNCYIKANKLGNQEDKVAWQLSFDESSMIQVGNTGALSASIINASPAYLAPPGA